MDLSTTTNFLTGLLGRIPEFIQNTAYAKYVEYWPIFMIGFLLSLLLTPILGHIALKFNITYIPKKGRGNREFDNPLKALHEGITPSLGGLAITLPSFIAILIFFKMDSFTLPIVISLFVLMLGATLDDIFNLPAKIQFIYQIITAGIIAFSILNISSIPLLNMDLSALTYNFSIFNIEQSLALPGDIILFFWILVCINAVKWTAGSPGVIEANSFKVILFP